MSDTEKRVLLASGVALLGPFVCLCGIAAQYLLSPLSRKIFELMAMALAPLPAVLLGFGVFAIQLLVKDYQLKWLFTIGLFSLEFLVGQTAANMTNF